MAGRPKRTEEVAAMTLRLPPALLARVNRCKALCELQEGSNLSRTDVLWRIIDAGCQVLEGEMAYSRLDLIPDSPESPERSRTPAVLTSQPDHRTAGPKALEGPGNMTTPVVSTVTPQTDNPAQPVPASEHMQRVAEERAKFQYSRMSYRTFAQHLFDRGIYWTTTKDGRKVPANGGTIKKMLDRAARAGLL
jgi:hypothetical protein